MVEDPDEQSLSVCRHRDTVWQGMYQHRDCDCGVSRVYIVAAKCLEDDVVEQTWLLGEECISDGDVTACACRLENVR